MKVLCTGYFDTGFTGDNYCDSPTLLASSARSTRNFGYLDLFQIDDLNTIQLYLRGDYVPLGETMVGQSQFADFNEPSDLDYIVLSYDTTNAHTVFYRVLGYRNIDAGTVEFSVEKDPLLTIGGVGKFDILDGITERVSLAPSMDINEVPVEEDSLLVTTKPLEITNPIEAHPFVQGATGSATIIESALNLGQMGKNYIDGTQGNAYEYVTTGGDSVVVPQPIYITENQCTTVQLYTGGTQIKTPGTAYWNLNDANGYVKKGLEIANALGLTSAIVSSYVIPYGYQWSASQDSLGRYSLITGYFSPIGGSKLENVDNIKYEYPVLDGNTAYTVKNKRVFLGELNKFTIQAVATGEKVEARPEELMYASDVSGHPSIYCLVDPRSGGKPYYKFRYFRNIDSASDILNMIQCAVKGMGWQEAPQVYTQKSGSLIDNLNYRMEEDISNYMFETSQVNTANAVKRTIRDAADILLFGSTEEARNILGREYWGRKENQAFLQNASQNVKRDADFNISQKVVAPTMTFPLNETMRDFYGNGCILYRVKPIDADIVRMDRLLTMYGNRYTRALQASDFNSRPNFNYVKASGVKVQYNGANDNSKRFKCSSRLADQVGALLSDGVRIWHKRPNYSYYNQAN